jgi:hypothetical protein
MNRQTVYQVINDATTVIERAQALLDSTVQRYNFDTKEREQISWQYTSDNPKLQGALRRASMELTRSLAAMRKP